MKDILLVEDNRHILDGNRYFLEKAGYTCAAAETIAGAKKIIGEETPRLMILDLMLPDGNGLDLLSELRASSDPALSGMPVLILTGLGSNPDVVRGLSAGGDDYLPKPYDYEVLLARVKALMRRSGMNRAERSGDIIERGALKLDILSSQAFLRGEDLYLTPKQFALLLLLVRGEGKILSNEYLYETVWKQPLTDDCGALWKQMSRLRAKLDEVHGVFITQFRGEGYCLEISADN